MFDNVMNLFSGKGDHNHLENLISQKKYRQAIEEFKKIQRSQPNAVFMTSEVELWLLRGHQEIQKGDYKGAESSFRQALKFGVEQDLHYWIAKALLLQRRLDAALDFIKNAFADRTLPKEEGICYLKLLLMKGQWPEVEQLVDTQAQRFSSAHLHWVKGVLALQAKDPAAALKFFGKVKQPSTPGDSMPAWLTYAAQQQQNWSLAAQHLGLTSSVGLSKFPVHAAMQNLAIFQQAMTGERQRKFVNEVDRNSAEILKALSAVELMAIGNFHDAGHGLLKLRALPCTTELMAMKSTILMVAGEQAVLDGESACARQLWQPLMSEKELNPQWAVNFLDVLEEEDEHQERQRLLTRLIRWIEQDAKQNSGNWPSEKLQRTLAHAHCLMADSLMALERGRAALGSVQQAARICPDSPEVIARQGLVQSMEGHKDKAIELLTQALDGGSECYEAYYQLQDLLIDCGRKDEAAAIQKRHGKAFGDGLPDEAEVEVELWIQALAGQDYRFFDRFLPKDKSEDPAVRACQIFRAAAQGKLTGTGKTSIDQAQAQKNWDLLLAGLEPAEQIKALLAIALSIAVLSKRDKGIAALSAIYVSQIFGLTKQVPAAQVAHLIVLAVKENKPDKLQVPIRMYLDAAPQPGTALALLQLQVRWFAQTAVLRSFIEAALTREPQNPLLLLAQATTYLPTSKSYEQFRSTGFDLARRLQDAQALQAFRQENYFLKKPQTKNIIFDQSEINLPPILEEMFEKFFREMVPKGATPEMIEILRPILFKKFMEEIPEILMNRGFGDDDDDAYFDPDDDDYRSSRSRGKKRKSFMEL
jgi:tetratricopeptide (TPR) repeat protein